MHDTVTKSPATTKFYRNSNNELLPPFSLSPTTNTRGWTQEYDSDSEASLENWQLSTPKDAPIYPTNVISSKRTIPSIMPTRTENGTSDRTMTNGQRWRLNTSGQLVDTEAAAAGWDLADEIVRLKIGEVTGDTDDVHHPIRTPPKSKLASAAVAQASPLDSSSNTSVGSSPHASDHQINISHSRGSSADTTISSSHESVGNHALLHHPPLKTGPSTEAKERPHSFSGGLSSADLRRLQQAGGDPEQSDRQLQQQQQWAQNQYFENAANPEQLSYPSLANNIHRPQPQHAQMYDYRSNVPQQAPAPEREDYNAQQRGYSTVPQAPPPQFVQGRPTNGMPAMAYRQQPPPRGFPQQGVVPNQAAMGYPGAHHASLSLGSTQQLYDMMLPAPPPHDAHPAVNRVQQQHNVFRGTHHHSASDPSALRDVAALALLNNNLQGFPSGMFQPGMPPPPAMAMYPNQFYGQDAAAHAMAVRLQAQYNNAYAVLPQVQMVTGDSVSSPTSTSGQNGPSANNRKLGLYKTELCRSWEEKGTCRYGAKCQFAHGEDELRKVARHPKYKTEICRTFWVSGSCPYGKRCCFIHTELPTAGGATPATAGPGADSIPPQPRPDGRARSLSTNSDPNEASVSLLARISAKRTQDSAGNATPIDMNSGNSFQFTRPPTGSLRVDTSALDGPSVKQQNKSAYPSFASNGILMPAPEHIAAKSPAPVTAGPDLGRHNNSRLEIVGYNNQPTKKTNANSNVRHSFNGTEVDLSFSPSPPATGHSSYALPSGDGVPSSRANGHVRAGSAGNWGSFGRSSHLTPSAYPHASSPAGEIIANSPWSSTELAMGSSRLHEKAWA
ncbi:hypothetical protein BDQ12DRAFT_600759 [Crucibulum laeve]|uniref:C3H1-type domain-containing protein n=1 Tax=Crucibulum laeve TaxID=68775 RepID=A0A5C3M9E1_9AGAR|nr:hypothetical protein BDQ12DRAFT_600759 [Crucibulum laeve]